MDQHLLRTLSDNTLDLIYAKDREGRFIFVNKTLVKLLGLNSAEQVLGKTDFDLHENALAQGYTDDDQQVMREGVPLADREELVADAHTGENRWHSTTKVPLLDEAGSIIGVMGITRDITLAKQSELKAQNLNRELETRVAERTEELRALSEALATERNLMRTLVDSVPDNIFAKDINSKFLLANDAVARGMGTTREDLIGKDDFDFFPRTMAQSFFEDEQAILRTGEPLVDREEPAIDKVSGNIRWLLTSKVPVRDESGRITGLVGIGRDISERKITEERIQYLATHDSLTDLPNRTMFSEILNLAIESAKRHQRQLAVLFIDLDRFKNINDTLGHESGDLLLREMSKRFKKCLRASDVVARLGGDEFVILVQEVDEPNQVSKVAQKILSAAIKPVDVLGQEIRVTASVGICMYPNDGDDENSLMKNADIAMYRAKDEGKNTYQFYSPDIKARSLERLILENNLRMALERNEFFLHYQAKRDLKSGAIAGVEALVRWQHPALGAISPAQFIPLAEETGLIVLIGRWVLKTACAQNVAWQKEGLPPLCMAVNLSARQFFDEQLVSDVAAALNDSGMQPELLEMEITEGMVMQDAERAVKILTDIKKLGVRLAIDDFGVGYSSLAQIKRFPIDTLKVDSSFIRDIPQNIEDRAITEAIIAMGRTLSLTVVAEGVETEAQESFLRDHACDQSQGFYFSRPIAPDDFLTLMKKQISHAAPYPPESTTD
ncbi:MAG TPA: EAL domain-containing protein [Cellvibrionaceae bacterium]